MKKSHNKVNFSQQELSGDIQFLLSSIRARQNGLIFFLQHFSALHSQHKDEYRTYKNQFLQKQKIYTQQVEQTLSKYSKIAVDATNHILRTFWLKLKSILKVSLQRIKILDLLNERIFERYENMINLINKNYDQEKGLSEFRQIQDYLKKRNLDALVLGRNHLSSQPQAKIIKNHSQTYLKIQNQSNNQQSNFELNIEHTLQHPRMKSLNRIKNRKNQEKYAKVISSSKTCQRHYKKFAKNVEKYEKNIQSVMDGKLDIAFDRKKTIFDNVYSIYDNLFQKNIAVHKAISKFVYTSCGFKKILILKKTTQKKKGQKIKQKQISRNRDRKRAETAQLPKKFESLDQNLLQNKNLKTSKGKKKIFILQNSLPTSKHTNFKVA